MSREHKALSAIAAAVILITLWVHWPSVHNGFLYWDDETYLEKAIEVQPPSIASVRWAFTTIYFGNYHPLTWISYIVDWRIWGRNPAGHHATSVVLHAANAGLVVLFVWMLLRTAATLSVGQQLAAAAGVGLVFGIHPLQVESVAWIAQRKTVLCGFFLLASLCTYLWYTQRPQARGRLWAATALFVAALLSKAMAISLPVVMLALDFYPLRRHRTLGWLTLVKEKVVLICLVVANGAISFVAQAQTGAVVQLDHVGVWGRVLVAERGVIFYLWKLLWPAWLSPFYPLQGVVSLGHKEFLVPAIAVVAITVGSVWGRNKMPGLLSGWIAYLAMIGPVSGLLQVGSQSAADRYMYLALLPGVLLLVGACVWFWQRVTIIGRIAVVVLIVCYALFLGFRTREQIIVWQDDETLWRSALRRFPNSGLANCEMAKTLARAGRFDEAYAPALKAVRFAPGFGQAHATIGYVYLKAQRYTEAAEAAQEALRLDPSLLQARSVLASAYSRQGRFDEALRVLQDLLARSPQIGRALAQDAEMAALRQDPEYGPRLHALVTGAREQSSP